MVMLMAMAVEKTTDLPAWLTPLIIVGTLVQFAFNAIVAVSIHRSRQVTDKVTRLEQSLHEAVTKLVDERFRAMTHEINGHVQGLLTTIDDMKQRLEDGEDNFDTLAERDQKIELAVAAKCDAIKEAIRQTTASREDFLRHENKVDQKFGYTDQRIGEVREMLAAVSERLGVKTQGGRRG